MRPFKRLEQVFCRHLWQEWTFYSERSCRQRRFCLHCGKVESRDAPHHWAGWGFIENESCVQERVCLRDGVVERRNLIDAIQDGETLEDQLSAVEALACSNYPGARSFLENLYSASTSTEEESNYYSQGGQDIGEDITHELQAYPNAKGPLRQELEFRTHTICRGTANYEAFFKKPANRAHVVLQEAIDRLKAESRCRILTPNPAPPADG